MDQELQQKEAEDRRRADADRKAARDEEKRQTTEGVGRKRQELTDVSSASRVTAAAPVDEAEVLETCENVDSAVEVDVSSVGRKGETRVWTQRPQNWRDLTEHYLQYGLRSLRPSRTLLRRRRHRC